MTVIVSGVTDTSTARNGGSMGGALAQTHGVAATAGSFPPAVEMVLDDKGAKQGVIGNGGHTDDGRPQITGKADAGVVVHIYNDSELIGKVTVGANETWSFIPRSPLVDGRHEISVIHEHPDGDVSEISAPYVIFVDKLAPETPIILEMVDDEGRITGGIAVEGITDDGRPTVDGTTEANATVIVYDKDREIGRVQADSTGKWSFTPESALADGMHILQYMAVDQAGNQSEKSDWFEFMVDTRPELVNIYIADDNVGSVTGPLWSGSSTDDSTPTLQGTATAGGIVKIYEGNVLLGETTASVDGRWTFTPVTPLSEGSHALQATVTLVAKGESDRSANFNLIVDQSVPDAPAITGVIDGVGTITGNIQKNGITDDARPEIVGVAQPNTTVSVYVDGNLLGVVAANSQGYWSLVPDADLAEGLNSITAIATNSVGTISPPTEAYPILVDFHAPPRALIDSLSKDSGVSSSDYLTNDGSAGRLLQGTFSEALAAGDKVEVSIDRGLTWQSALVHEDGTWSFVDKIVHGSSWEVQTRVTSAVGNTAVDKRVVILDSEGPEAPLSIVRNENSAEVEFSSRNLSVGDTVNVVLGDLRVNYALTDQDLLNGKALIDLGSAATNINSALTAALVDAAGNRSDYIDIPWANLESFTNVSVGTYRVIDLGGFSVKALTIGGDFTVGEASSASWGRLDGKALWLGNTQSVYGYDVFQFDLKNPVKTISMKYGADEGGENYFEYFNAQGKSLGVSEITKPKGPNALLFSAPEGELVSYFVYRQEAEGFGIVIDDVHFDGGVSAYDSVNQIVGGQGQYYGGIENNVFSVADGSLLNGEKIAIHGGRGLDTLKLTGSNQVLDLTGLGHNLTSTEVINITGKGNNMLTLGLSQVLENGAVNAFHTGDKGRVQMLVNGNAGDKVVLSDLLDNGNDFGDWVKASAVIVNGLAYDSYQHSSLDAELLVQLGVTVTVTNSATVGVESPFGTEQVKSTALPVESAMLTLNLSQVMNEGGVNLFHDDGRTQMIVKGNAGDSINLDDLLGDGVTDLGDWAVAGTQTVDGVAYNVYQHSGLDAELLVQESVKVNLI